VANEKIDTDQWLSENRCFLLAFIIPVIIRAIPELLMGRYLVGFDLMGYYFPEITTWLAEGMPLQGYTTGIPLLTTAPLFYFILIGFISIGFPLSITLKVLPSILHGFLALVMYYYARRVMAWSEKKSLLVSLFGTFYFVALRVSWDLLRNQLALSLLFVALILLQKSGNKARSYLALSMLLPLIVITNQLITVLILFIVIVTIIHRILVKELRKSINLVVASLPAILLFLYIAFLQFNVEHDVNWLVHFGFSSYSHMALTMLGLLLYCYWPLLVFVVKGIRDLKNLQLRAWVLICLVLTFISVREGVENRWVFLLTYPFAFFTVDAVATLRRVVKLKGYQHHVIAIFSIIVIVLSGSFIAMPNTAPFPYFQAWPMQKYIPSSMLQNTIALEDCPDTENALDWVNSRMEDHSLFIAHTAFYGWALQTLNVTHTQHYGWGNPAQAAEEAKTMGYTNVYTIWWVRGLGWNPPMPDAFQMVYQSNRIAIYEYQSTSNTQ
jgi:hypothetical protein